MFVRVCVCVYGDHICTEKQMEDNGTQKNGGLDPLVFTNEKESHQINNSRDCNFYFRINGTGHYALINK